MRSAILQMKLTFSLKLFMGLFVSPFHRCFQQGFSFSGTAYYYTWRLSSKKPGRASLADAVWGTVWPGLHASP